MKRLFTLFLIIHCHIVYGKPDTDSLINELNNAISNTRLYDNKKLRNIEELKRSFNKYDNQLASQYDLALKLYDEYKIFKFDSAFVYAKRSEAIASQLNDPSRLTLSKIRLSFILLSAGMFKETSDYLNEINISDQPEKIKAEYYSLTGRYYYDLADYNDETYYKPIYIKRGNDYMDSALAIYPANSFEHYFYDGLKNLKQGNLKKSYSDYQTLISLPNLTHHQVALITSTLSTIHSKEGKTDLAIDYQMMAAIADIKSSTKETYAIFNLAELLFKTGDLERASLYIQKAIADASFYGARLRKVQVSSILPIIQGKRIDNIEGQKRYWIIYAVVVTLVLALLGFLIVTIYKQFNKLKNAKRIITEAHANLHAANSKLLEANKIKEEYIGYFFNINSEYFQKINKFKKSIEQKIADRKLDDIKFIVSNINVKKEKEELLKSFDKVFLKLFPNFVTEFNALFKEEDQVKLRENEYLNTDLRIFALIRMGITEMEKVAQILEYSVNTIYAYKTRIKNKSIVPKEEFEKRIMDIKSL